VKEENTNTDLVESLRLSTSPCRKRKLRQPPCRRHSLPVRTPPPVRRFIYYLGGALIAIDTTRAVTCRSHNSNSRMQRIHGMAFRAAACLQGLCSFAGGHSHGMGFCYPSISHGRFVFLLPVLIHRCIRQQSENSITLIKRWSD